MDMGRESERLASAILDGAETAPPAAAGGALSLDQAYAVQDGVIAALERAGMVRCGAKIGLSAAAAQAAFGLKEPLSGLLFEGMPLQDGAALAAGQYRHPRVEAEICFRLGADLDDPELTEEAARAAIAEVMPAIEVVDSRYPGWSGGPMDMLAENISAAWFVCGAPVEGADPAALESAAMTMRVNGETVAEGIGRATHGGPLKALVWLARNLARRGHPLRAGDWVMSGAFAPMHPVAAGDEVRVEIAGAGAVSVTFAAG